MCFRTSSGYLRLLLLIFLFFVLLQRFCFDHGLAWSLTFFTQSSQSLSKIVLSFRHDPIDQFHNIDGSILDDELENQHEVIFDGDPDAVTSPLWFFLIFLTIVFNAETGISYPLLQTLSVDSVQTPAIAIILLRDHLKIKLVLIGVKFVFSLGCCDFEWTGFA